MKGQKARAGGGVHVRFEGGQTPISRRIPKFGRVKRKYEIFLICIVNLNKSMNTLTYTKLTTLLKKAF